MDDDEFFYDDVLASTSTEQANAEVTEHIKHDRLIPVLKHLMVFGDDPEAQDEHADKVFDGDDEPTTLVEAAGDDTKQEEELQSQTAGEERPFEDTTVNGEEDWALIVTPLALFMKSVTSQCDDNAVEDMSLANLLTSQSSTTAQTPIPQDVPMMSTVQLKISTMRDSNGNEIDDLLIFSLTECGTEKTVKQLLEEIASSRGIDPAAFKAFDSQNKEIDETSFLSELLAAGTSLDIVVKEVCYFTVSGGKKANFESQQFWMPTNDKWSSLKKAVADFYQLESGTFRLLAKTALFKMPVDYSLENVRFCDCDFIRAGWSLPIEVDECCKFIVYRFGRQDLPPKQYDMFLREGWNELRKKIRQEEHLPNARFKFVSPVDFVMSWVMSKVDTFFEDPNIQAGSVIEVGILVTLQVTVKTHFSSPYGPIVEDLLLDEDKTVKEVKRSTRGWKLLNGSKKVMQLIPGSYLTGDEILSLLTLDGETVTIHMRIPKM